MSLLKRFTRVLLFTAVLFLTGQSLSFADGGFPVRPGRLLISPSVSYFFANSQWDTTGAKKQFPNGGRYSSVGISIYSEYGISRRFTGVLSVPYVFNNYTQTVDPKNTTSSGLTDLEAGLRYYLANINYEYYFSLQGTGIIPTYVNNPALGYGEYGTELKLAVSGTLHLFGNSGYFNAADGVRQYFGTNGPIQNRYNATLGLSLDNDFENLVSVSGTGIWSNSDNKAFSPVVGSNKDYSFFQLSLSYGHAFSREISLFANAGKFLTGYNTSAGTTFSMSFIYRLDYN
jgi:hypothetical protein